MPRTSNLPPGQADLTIFPVTDTPTPTPTSIFEGYNGWRAEYFDNASLSGRPVLVRDDANINFNWGSGTPATGVPTDNFSVRWQRFITFDDDRIYRFNLKKNDGARVWFDDRLIIDLWDDDDDGRTYYNRTARDSWPTRLSRRIQRGRLQRPSQVLVAGQRDGSDRYADTHYDSDTQSNATGGQPLAGRLL